MLGVKREITVELLKAPVQHDIVTYVRQCQQTRSIALVAGVVLLCEIKSVVEGSSALRYTS
jgi:hypothetical protein|eukprot:COSAG01_NODE_3550_length_5949_cov_2.333846_3_plen_61_part_00